MADAQTPDPNAAASAASRTSNQNAQVNEDAVDLSLLENLITGSVEIVARRKDRLLGSMGKAMIRQEQRHREFDQRIASLEEIPMPTRPEVEYLDVATWSKIGTVPELQAATSFFRIYFEKALSRGGFAAAANLRIALSLMSLCATSPVAENEHFLVAARTAVAELIVANYAAQGMAPVGLNAIRDSLTNAALPTPIQEALKHAKIMERLTDQRKPPQPGS